MNLQGVEALKNREPGSYFSIGDFYKKTFGEKVQKVSVSISEDCPNRRGLKGMETCVFCDPWGSAAYVENQEKALDIQIKETQEHVLKHCGKGAKKILIYFQAYTSTFSSVKKLRSHIEVAADSKEVVGFVLGTRPDCLADGVFKLLDEYKEKYFVSIELGVQSFFEDQLEFLKRGHSAASSIGAISKIKSHGIDVRVHLMFGMPGETDETIIETAQILNRLKVDNVKLHNLHVLKSTGLEDLYSRGTYFPPSRSEYAHRVSLFLEHLSPEIAVQRLSAVATRWDELVAPLWTRHKMETHMFILNDMKKKGAFQGHYAAANIKPQNH